jgi:hypothetical protein
LLYKVWPKEISFPGARGSAVGEAYCTLLSHEASTAADRLSYVAAAAVVVTVLASAVAVSSDNKVERRIPMLAISMLCATLGLWCFARAEAAGEVVASVTNARFPENGDVPNDGVALAVCARARAEWERSRSSANQVVKGILEDRLRRSNENLVATTNQAKAAEQERDQSKQALESVEDRAGQAASAAPSGSAGAQAAKLAEEVKALAQPALGSYAVVVSAGASDVGACADVKNWPNGQPPLFVYKTLAGLFVSVLGPYPSREAAAEVRTKIVTAHSNAYVYSFSRSWSPVTCTK